MNNDNVKELKVRSLRERMGVVSQEPILFDRTIAENIRFGNPDASMNDIVSACRTADALTFIERLPQKFNTLAGKGGAQLSGGQKQRIAIARALVRNPSVLLLDEATSALDAHGESVIQRSLDKIRAGRTTIIVAHRLSTVKKADRIYVVKDGCVAEVGTHEELMEEKGLYYNLVLSQLTSHNEDDYEEEPQSPSCDTTDDEPVISGIKMVDLATNKIKETNEEASEFANEPKSSTLRIMRLNGREWPYLTLGLSASVCMGVVMPIEAVIFGDVLGTLSSGIDIDAARTESRFFAALFLILGAAAGFISFVQHLAFSVSGEKLTMRVRKMTFEAILRQEIGWFDDPENSTGALCSRLSGDCSAVQGATGIRIGSIIQAAFTVFSSIAIALYLEWRLGRDGHMGARAFLSHREL